MFPFKRKKGNEEEDAQKIKIKGKQGKDLTKDEEKTPRKKRKKIEPQKPWGKIERLIVLAFLLLAPALSVFFLIHSKNANSAKLSLAGSNVLSDAISKDHKDSNALKNELVSEIQGLQGTYGIWIQALDNSYSIGINEKQSFDGASFFKLPLMIAYYQAVDKGTINPDTNYSIKYIDAESGAGILATLPPGTIVTYRDMVNDMGKYSDNTAFFILSNILGENAETNIINQVGMTNTDFVNSQTTPYDIGFLFNKLASTNLISSNSKEELFASLTGTNYENYIPAGIPHNIQVAHKYGADDGELNDGGIIYASKPFILVIMSKGIDDKEANSEIPKLAKLVYDWASKW